MIHGIMKMVYHQQSTTRVIGGHWLLFLVATALFLLLSLPSLATTLSEPNKNNDQWIPPDFCGQLDCPKYTTYRKTPDFEAREYQPTCWATTNVSSLTNTYHSAVKKGSRRLFRYFWGQNKQTIRMKETVPLSVHFLPIPHPHLADAHNFTVGMMIPFTHQDHPPDPSLPSSTPWQQQQHEYTIEITCLPKIQMYVRMIFEKKKMGFDRGMEEARELAAALDALGLDYDTDCGVVFANYNHPGRGEHHHRHHHHHYLEVWLAGRFEKEEVA